MTAETNQEVKLSLPPEIVERLVQTALRRHQPMDQVVTEVLGLSLPPLRLPAETEMRSRVDALSKQSHESIQQALESRLPDEAQQRLSELLARNRDAILTSDETAELDTLLDRVQSTAVESAAARLVLSKHRSASKL